VLTAVDKFYSEVVQHIKPWAPAPPKIRESEEVSPDEPTSQDGILASGGDRDAEDPNRVLVADSLGAASSPTSPLQTI
jgi:hypothetical protein